MADQPAVTTSIDSLVKYLKEHGETDTTMLSRVLSVNEGTIVDWADILEKAGMVKIAYKVGRMYLSPTEGKMGEKTQVEKAVGEVKKEIVENEVRSQESVMKEIRAKLDVYSKTVKNAEALFKEKGGEASATLRKITLLEREASKYYDRIDSKRESVAKMVEGLDKEMGALETEAEKIRQFNLDTSGAKASLSDIANKMASFNSSLSQMDDEFEKMVADRKARLKAMEDGIREELGVLRDTTAAERKRIAEYDRALEGYREIAGAQERKAKRLRTQMLDEAVRTKAEVLGAYSAASSQFNALNQSIKTMKESWGLLAVFDGKLTSAREGIAALSKQLDALEKELSGTEEEMKKPGSDAGMRTLESRVKVMRSATSSASKESDRLRDEVAGLSK